MNPNSTDITLILDRSGSMESIRTDMEGAIKAFVADQAQVPVLAGGDCRLSVLQFDSTAIEWLFQAEPIGKVGAIALEPRGTTPLLDALGKSIHDTGKRLAAMPEKRRPGRVLFVVITDGEENASREWTSAQVKALVEQQRSVYKWEFLFLGANLDAAAEAAAIGIAHAADYVADSAGVANMTRKARYAASSFRGGGQVNEGLARADAEEAEEKKAKPTRRKTTPVN